MVRAARHARQLLAAVHGFVALLLEAVARQAPSPAPRDARPLNQSGHGDYLPPSRRC